MNFKNKIKKLYNQKVTLFYSCSGKIQMSNCQLPEYTLQNTKKMFFLFKKNCNASQRIKTMLFFTYLPGTNSFFESANFIFIFDFTGNTSDLQEAISEGASSHSVGSVDFENDNFSDMISLAKSICNILSIRLRYSNRQLDWLYIFLL
jgi:hypothetical protein